MHNFIVEGGHALKGVVDISGSKNAVLPIICATLLTNEKCTLKNVPNIADVNSIIEILRSLGSEIQFENNTVTIQNKNLTLKNLSGNLVAKMRASILLLGPLLARIGEAKMNFPGGCVLGKRSVDSHTHSLKKLGAEILDEKKGLHLKAKKLKGTNIVMPEMSVTATENALMAAVLAKGVTRLRLVACEPHVQDLCRFLNKMGANIKGVGTHYLTIEGVKKLHTAEHRIIGDYLEAGTFAIASAITAGDVLIRGINPVDLDSFWQKLEDAGVELKIEKNSVRVKAPKRLKSVKMIKTAVYPGFPTDLQAPFVALMTKANGVSKVFETLFEGRLNYLFELEKMGAHVEFLNPHQAIIIGPAKLKGLPIASCDLRAGAAMVLAALAADGITEISNIRYIDRGYENFDQKLISLGAKIERVAFEV